MGKGKKFLNFTGGKTHAVRTLTLPPTAEECAVITVKGDRQESYDN